MHNKQSRSLLFKIIAAGFVIAALVPGLLTVFFFAAYLGIGVGLSFLLLGVVTLFMGVIKLRATNRDGTLLHWWKSSHIIMPLFFGCIGTIVLMASLPTPLQGGKNNAILFFLLTLAALGLGIYGMVLTVRQSAVR